MREGLERKTLEYVGRNKDILRDIYGGKYIAIVDGEVVIGSHGNLKDIRKIVKRIIEDKPGYTNRILLSSSLNWSVFRHGIESQIEVQEEDKRIPEESKR